MTSNISDIKKVVDNKSDALNLLIVALIASNSRFQRYYPLSQLFNYQLGLFPDLLNTLKHLVKQGWLRHTSEPEKPAIYQTTPLGKKELSQVDMDSVFQQLEEDVKNKKLFSALQKML